MDLTTGTVSHPLALSLATKKLSAETLTGLESFLASLDDEHRESIAYSVWVNKVLREPKAIARHNIERLLWHHGSGQVRLKRADDLQFIVGLMQFDTHWGEKTTLNREQETAVIKLEQELATRDGSGVSFGNAYGNGLRGTRILYVGLGEYVVEHPERVDDMCWLIRERRIRSIKKMAPLLAMMPVVP
jgi:hypothetical protein